MFLIGFKSGNWLGLCSGFLFFLWNQLRASSAVCLGSVSCWNVHPRFIFSILVDGSGFLSRVSRYISPFSPPSNYMRSAGTVMQKNSPTRWCSHLRNFTVGVVFLGCVMTSTDVIPVLSEARHEWPLALGQLLWLIFWLLIRLMFFPLPDNDPNGAHWNIQPFRNTSVINDMTFTAIRLQ